MFKKGVFFNIVIILVLILGLNSMSPVEVEQSYDEETHNCRFWGVISTDVPTSVIQDHLVNLPNSVKNLGDFSNPDGWSVGYYPDGNDVPTVNRGHPQAFTDPNFNIAATAAADATPRIVVSHVRNASSGTVPGSGDPHPFERVKDGRHWLMGHNGTIDKNVLVSLIRPDYLTANPPLYGSNQSEWIDSDLYQIFVLQTLEDFNFQVEPALGYVIRRLREEIGPSTSPSDELLNFFLTDGTTLWAYREGNSTHTLFYLYDSTGTPYSAVASQYPSASQGNWVEVSDGQLVTMEQTGPPVVENIEIYFGGAFLADNYFDESADSVALRTNGPGQDWYESRADDPTLLFLDETLIGGNGSKKAGFTASSSANAYLSQEFGTPQSGTFSVQWNIYLDNIADDANLDRAGLMLIGDDADGSNGPNSTSDDRFVFMAFYCADGCETGTADLIAREPGDDYATSTEWRTVATGLNLDEWNTIQVDCAIAANTYDVYVDGVLADSGVQAYAPKTSVTHISFAQWNDATGAFYVDNVYQNSTGTGFMLTMAVDPINAGATDPSVGGHSYPEDTLVSVSAYGNPGYEFDHWTGDVTDPNSATTTVLMDENQTITAHYSNVPIVLLVDNYFDDSADSTELRIDSPGQDWYESFGETTAKLTLDSSNIMGNSGNKAALKYSDPTGPGNAYLTQDFGSPQSGTFAVSFDIYIDSIEENGDRDRTGMIYIGDDSGGTDGPNSLELERFVFLTFYDPNTASDENDLEIRAKEFAHDHPTDPQLWHTTSTWTQITSGLSYDTWYEISLYVNVAGGTYDVYVDDVLLGDDISGNEDYGSNSVSHISFYTGNGAQGDFFVDNIEEIGTSAIQVDANFDSGSIGPYSLSSNEINLDLRTDVVGYQYWTYFSASNVLNQEITVNLAGIDSIPFLAEQTEENQMVYSCDGENWNRLTSHSYSPDAGGTYTFVETFTCDPVQIATFFPFPYEKMHTFVDTVSASPWAVETVLGSSHQGRDIDLLTITNPAIPNTGKHIIYIIGRQHAAETSSSHMLEGMLNFLISNDPDAARMRDNFVWYIVPMVNPDGVYSGKSRETSEGNDPNRDWHRSNNDTQGVSLVKAHMDSINNAESIDMFIDWHSQMNDDRWYNFTYAPSGNTFFPILSSWTDIDFAIYGWNQLRGRLHVPPEASPH